jgi:hypothetical protein
MSNFFNKLTTAFSNFNKQPENLESIYKEVVANFASEYVSLAKRLHLHMRYERDFGKDQTNKQNLQDPVDLKVYSKDLTEIIRSLVESHVPKKQRVFGEDVLYWYCLVQILIPESSTVYDLLKEQTRIELCGHTLLCLWNNQGRLASNVRRYYEKVYQTPSWVLNGTTSDECLRLYKAAATVAEENVRTYQISNEEIPKHHEKSRNPDLILYSLFSQYKCNDSQEFRKMFSKQFGQILNTIFSFLLFSLILSLPESVIQELLSDLFSFIPESTVLSIRALTLFGIFIVCIQMNGITKTKARRRSLVITIRSLIETNVVSYGEVLRFVENRFDQNSLKLIQSLFDTDF